MGRALPSVSNMANMDRTLCLMPLRGIPLIQQGDELAEIVLQALDASEQQLQSRDVLVVAQKIVSKAEGRSVDLRSVTPSERAIRYAELVGKDARLVELILSESTEVVRHRPGLLIVAHRLGLVIANAGIDFSNVGPEGEEQALLLPLDPDRSCRELRMRLHGLTGVDVAVLVIDSVGRAWRNGTVGTAIGVSGLPALVNLRGQPDLFGRTLQSTEIGLADEVAAAASLVMGQGEEGCPVVLARGLPYERCESKIGDLIRPNTLDLFR
jgi:coenzyme F420-0:L-glutamate ligase/coenzyme F420-1:gamma-L-glutamate ligase